MHQETEPTNQPGSAETSHESEGFVSRGGSCIVSPLGEVLEGTLWEVEHSMLTVKVDFDDFLRGRLDLDVAGDYSRYGSCC